MVVARVEKGKTMALEGPGAGMMSRCLERGEGAWGLQWRRDGASRPVEGGGGGHSGIPGIRQWDKLAGTPSFWRLGGCHPLRIRAAETKVEQTVQDDL